MDMGSDDGGGFGLGLLLDFGDWKITLLVILVFIGVGLYCGMQKTEQKQNFCSEVCSQYHDQPVIQGSSCFCRDSKGIYDPSFRSR